MTLYVMSNSSVDSRGRMEDFFERFLQTNGIGRLLEEWHESLHTPFQALEVKSLNLLCWGVYSHYLHHLGKCFQAHTIHPFEVFWFQALYLFFIWVVKLPAIAKNRYKSYQNYQVGLAKNAVLDSAVCAVHIPGQLL